MAKRVGDFDINQNMVVQKIQKGKNKIHGDIIAPGNSHCLKPSLSGPGPVSGRL